MEQSNQWNRNLSKMKKKNILAIAAIALFCMAMTSCNKHKSCAAYSKADTVKTDQVES